MTFFPSVEQNELNLGSERLTYLICAPRPHGIALGMTTEFEKIGHVSELDRAGQFTRRIKNHDILVFRVNGKVRAFKRFLGRASLATIFRLGLAAIVGRAQA